MDETRTYIQFEDLPTDEIPREHSSNAAGSVGAAGASLVGFFKDPNGVWQVVINYQGEELVSSVFRTKLHNEADESLYFGSFPKVSTQVLRDVCVGRK